MTDDLVQTPNGTFVDRKTAEAAGLDVSHRRRVERVERAKPKSKATARRKAAGTSRKGKA